jgi:hypothetical protein
MMQVRSPPQAGRTRAAPEFRDTVTGTNAWQPLTNITLDTDAFILEQPLDAPSRFYRGVWLP